MCRVIDYFLQNYWLYWLYCMTSSYTCCVVLWFCWTYMTLCQKKSLFAKMGATSFICGMVKWRMIDHFFPKLIWHVRNSFTYPPSVLIWLVNNFVLNINGMCKRRVPCVSLGVHSCVERSSENRLDGWQLLTDTISLDFVREQFYWNTSDYICATEFFLHPWQFLVNVSFLTFELFALDGLFIQFYQGCSVFSLVQFATSNQSWFLIGYPSVLKVMFCHPVISLFHWHFI